MQAFEHEKGGFVIGVVRAVAVDQFRLIEAGDGIAQEIAEGDKFGKCI